MRPGVHYYITMADSGLVQEIDWWAFLCEIQEIYSGEIYVEGEIKHGCDGGG